MAHKIKTPAAKSATSRMPAAEASKPQVPPAEPAQVLGRHKNSGQKDHKGAR